MRDFFKTVLATLVGLILFVTLGSVGLAAVVLAIAAGSSDTEPTIADQTILTFDLSLNITDAPPSSDPGRLISESLAGSSRTVPIPLRTVLNAITAAAEDDRIVGLYLHSGGSSATVGTGFATLREVRRALEVFRESGKPIFAYSVDGGERDYYLTSVANTVALNPVGVLEMNGFSSQTLFFAEALERFGIGVQVIRAGRYKAAVEPFTRSDNSPEAEAQTQQLLNDLWNEFLTTAAQSRDTTPQQLQAIANDQGLLLPDQAASLNLIDQVGYEDEIIAELRQLTAQESDSKSFRQISLAEYTRTVRQNRARSSANRVALIYAEGEIVFGEGGNDTVGGDRLARQLRELREDDTVKAIVLRVNSPGGSATASEIVAREVRLTSEQKPVIVSMGSLAASGGYLIATYADQIFASPNTITGSIGVFGLLPNLQEITNTNGVRQDVVKTNPYADLGNIFRPQTPTELAISQRVVDRLYEGFLTSVAESRDLPRERVNEVAQGRVWSGAEAQRVGLVDELGGLDDAIQAAVSRAELGEDWQLDEYPRSRPFGQRLIEQLFSSQVAQSSPPSDPLTLELQKLRAELETLRSLNDPFGAYTRLPFNPWIR